MTARSTLRTAVAGAGLVAIGFWLAPRAAPTAAPAIVERAAPAVRVAAHADLDVGALRAEIRAAVRDERAATAPSVEAEAPTPVGDAPSDEQVAAADRGQALLDQVVARGRLTDDDALAMGPVLAAMDFDAAMEVRLAIAQAINADRLTIESPRSLP
jgi:hypothetical protein